MMGRTHALTGGVAGLAAAPLAGATTVSQAAVFAATTAGYALLPDLDHPSSSASRVLGWLTGLLSVLVRSITGLIYRLTKGPRDEPGIHRTVTHTALFAVLLGAGLGYWATTSPWVVVGIAAFGVLLAVDRLGDIAATLTAVAVLVLTVGTGGDLDELVTTVDGMAWTIGIAAGLGCLTHSLGDMVTESGAPLLFPLPIAGETYYEIRPPSLLRFSTNSVVEKRIVTPLFLVVLGVLSVWTCATATAIA